MKLSMAKLGAGLGAAYAIYGFAKGDMDVTVKLPGEDENYSVIRQPLEILDKLSQMYNGLEKITIKGIYTSAATLGVGLTVMVYSAMGYGIGKTVEKGYDSGRKRLSK